MFATTFWVALLCAFSAFASNPGSCESVTETQASDLLVASNDQKLDEQRHRDELDQTDATSRMVGAEPSGPQKEMAWITDDQDVEKPWEYPKSDLGWSRIVYGNHFKGLYPRLAHILERAMTPDASPEACLDFFRKWLDGELKGIVGFNNSGIVGSLKQVISLAELNDDKTRCSFKAYEILVKNDVATRGYAARKLSTIKRTHNEPWQLLDRVVNSISKKHSLECKDIYPERYRQIVADMEKKDAKTCRLREYLDSVLGSKDCVESHVAGLHNARAIDKAYSFIEQYYSLGNGLTGDEVKLRENLVDKSQLYRPSRINRDVVYSMCDRHIIEPCQTYVKRLGTNVFVPASFGLFVLEKEERYDPNDDRYRDFLHGWHHYRLCSSLLRMDTLSFKWNLFKKYELELEIKRLNA